MRVHEGIGCPKRRHQHPQAHRLRTAAFKVGKNLGPGKPHITQVRKNPPALVRFKNRDELARALRVRTALRTTYVHLVVHCQVGRSRE